MQCRKDDISINEYIFGGSRPMVQYSINQALNFALVRAQQFPFNVKLNGGHFCIEESLSLY